ncbi:sigma-70 family RNA polymerase sigma factor [Pseudonocardia endophytica]|uniref:RNA polymerase sigma-70 factor (ECF subfamily) n=1 Tax=Pseudonocardia endophytica TaxID=401976 RepID=A0A4R1HT31_PSEEN|nr:sigma-70 family RNA polymerase sigma factor [Pseudonocardia endophytica]TCK25824.1 RNA polymerase sigma-70 factor (ECF subfamily) [Pseudonocardia endophytica]
MGIDASEGDTADRAAGFEAHRGRLRAIAYRMLGSVADADDAVQETWLRFAGSDTGAVRNPAGWLTTVLSRICLDMLRARASRREEPWEIHLPDPVVSAVDRDDPEHQAVLADSVALALLVVLDTLSPSERLAFVLHDLFGVPFAQIGPMLDRSPAAAKQLASRARNRVRANPPVSNVDPGRQRAMAEAFLAAARDGDLARLMAVLDGDVVLRADTGDGPWGPSEVVRGAEAVAGRVTRFSGLARLARPVVVNGAPGYLTVAQGRPFSLLTVVVRDDRIVEIDVLADPDRLDLLLDGRVEE